MVDDVFWYEIWQVTKCSLNKSSIKHIHIVIFSKINVKFPQFSTAAPFMGMFLKLLNKIMNSFLTLKVP
jgi:hypothetical protein